MLSHAGPECPRERLPCVVLRFEHRLADVEAAREVRGERRGERAPGAVVAAWKPLPCIGAHDAAFRVQRVHDLRRRLVRSRDEHVIAAGDNQPLGTLRE